MVITIQLKYITLNLRKWGPGENPLDALIIGLTAYGS